MLKFRAGVIKLLTAVVNSVALQASVLVTIGQFNLVGKAKG